MGSTTEDRPLADAGRELTQDAGRLAERATDIGIQRVDQGREQVAEQVQGVAGAIRRVSTDLESEQPTIADLAQTAAEQAERMSQYLRSTDTRQIVRTVEDFGRRQPALFLGGAFVIGLAASRVLKAANGSDASRSGYAMSSGSTAYGIGSRRDGWAGTGSGVGASSMPVGAGTTSGTRDEGAY